MENKWHKSVAKGQSQEIEDPQQDKKIDTFIKNEINNGMFSPLKLRNLDDEETPTSSHKFLRVSSFASSSNNEKGTKKSGQDDDCSNYYIKSEAQTIGLEGEAMFPPSIVRGEDTTNHD